MSREIVERYWKAQDPFDPDALGKLRHPDWVAEWPQSGERIPGHEQDVAIHSNYPGYPEHELSSVAGQHERWALSPLLTPVRVSGNGHLWVVEAKLAYPDASTWFSVGIVELERGLVRRETIYFLEPLEAAEWRRRWARPISEFGGEPIDIVIEEGRANEELSRDTFRRFVETVARDGVEAAAKLLYHDDVVEEMPQSGERIEGLSDVIAVMTHHPTFPTFELGRTWALGNLLVAEIDMDYGGDPWMEVALLEFRGDKVAKATEYFTQSFDAPEWRTKWVEKM